MTGGYDCPKNLLDDRKESLQFITPLDVSFQNRTKDLFSMTIGILKNSKCKKSEQYFRDKFEIFIRLFDEHFTCHFQSHWRVTWRHTGRWTVTTDFLGDTTPPPPSITTLWRIIFTATIQWNFESAYPISPAIVFISIPLHAGVFKGVVFSPSPQTERLLTQDQHSFPRLIQSHCTCQVLLNIEPDREGGNTTLIWKLIWL